MFATIPGEIGAGTTEIHEGFTKVGKCVTFWWRHVRTVYFSLHFAVELTYRSIRHDKWSFDVRNTFPLLFVIQIHFFSNFIMPSRSISSGSVPLAKWPRPSLSMHFSHVIKSKLIIRYLLKVSVPDLHPYPVEIHDLPTKNMICLPSTVNYTDQPYPEATKFSVFPYKPSH